LLFRIPSELIAFACLLSSATTRAEPPATPVDHGSYEAMSLEELLNVAIVSASMQQESLGESPVPVTVITAEMIRQSGARNLQDALIMFVPGMTLVEDHNELNVAMRGVYASSQQKILIMLDGHRLNSRAYSSANPDFSIDLSKVKQIEVLRGPASSLYGNVALTAVINIITRKGKDVDGLTVSGGLGDYGQRTGHLLFGTSFLEGKGDVLVWGSLYRSSGQSIDIPASEEFSAVPVAGTALVGANQQPASYDLGFKLRFGDLSLMASRRYGKWTPPFSDTGITGEVYDANRYHPFQDNGPGLGQRYNHLELKYAHDLSKAIQFEASIYYDTSETLGYTITNPATGGGLFIGWNDDDVGGIVDARYSYSAGPAGSGAVTVGTQLEMMRLIGSTEISGSNGILTTVVESPTKPLLQSGHEETLSAFLQVKHQFRSWLVFNGGFRYDFKERHLGEPISDLSPRLALVFLGGERFDVKLSYSQSFVDAPYWYRYNSLASYSGSQSLRPEHLRSLQLTPTVTLLDGQFKNTLNLFYNNLYDFIFRNNAAVAPAPFYQNAGSLQTIGAEEEVAWIQRYYHLRGNATYQYLLKASSYPADESSHRINNVPSLVANVIADANPLFPWTDKLWLNASLRYTSSQLSPINITFKDAAGNVVNRFNEPGNEVKGYVVSNVGAHLSDFPVAGLDADATVYNVFNQRYDQGGSPLHPYPQPGRWFLVNLSYHLSPSMF
jgi:iron complex outermembrane receptor protein